MNTASFINSPIGKLPATWTFGSLLDVAGTKKRTIISGPFGSNIGSRFFQESGVPVIRGSNLSTRLGQRLIEDEFVFLSEKKAIELNSWAKAGDLVFTAAGTLGQVGLIEEHSKFDAYVISNKQLRASLDSTKIVNRFAYYWFASRYMQKWIVNNDTGSTIPLINLTVLKSLPVPVPPLPEQKAIAEVLSSLDDKIDLLHRQNATLEALAETLFRQTFIEEAQDDWEEVQLGAYVQTNLNTARKSDLVGYIRYLDTGALTQGSVEGFQDFAFEDAPSRARRRVKHNDVLISTVRPNQKHYGLVRSPDDDLIVSTGFCVIEATEISPYFVYVLLTRDEMTDYLHMLAEASTSAYPSLKPNDLELVEFDKPPDHLLNKFHEQCDEFWAKIESNQKQIQTLEKLRDTLLPKLMSGDVRVHFESEAA